MTYTLKNNLLLGGFVLLKFIFQYFMINPGFELHRDEFLYLDQARHPAWGFTSVPPVTSWISSIILLVGNNVIWVKFFPALFGALTIILVWKIIERLDGGLFACSLGALAMIFSIYMRINTMYQPNSLDILCWTFLFYCIIRYIGSEKTTWIYMIALVFAVGFLNKYTICFLLIGILAGMALTKHRVLFRQRTFYIGAGIAFLLIVPKLIWQIRHDFPVMHHMIELTDTQLVNNERISFLIQQAVFFLPSLFVLLFAGIGFFTYKPFHPYKVIGLSFIFVIGLFLFFNGKPYYALGLYPVLLAFGAVYIEYLTEIGWEKSLRIVALGVIIGVGCVFIPTTCPVFSPDKMIYNETIRKVYHHTGQLKWEDGKLHHLPQDYADMTGWKELTHLVDSAYHILPDEEKDQTLIFCDNYGQAGSINFYMKPYPAAGSFNADYKNWLLSKDNIFSALILFMKEGISTEKITKLFRIYLFQRLDILVKSKISRQEKEVLPYIFYGSRRLFLQEWIYGIFFKLLFKNHPKISPVHRLITRRL